MTKDELVAKGRTAKAETRDGDQMPSWHEVFLYFLFLGFVNVGGPVAQITMMYNHMVERRKWLTEDRFVKIMAFCHMLPGPEALQLAIYVGYLKRKLWGGILAGLTFIIPGAVVMIVLSWLYVKYGKLPPVNNALYVLKPAVLGIIAAGIIKLGRGRVCRNAFRGNQLPVDSAHSWCLEFTDRGRLATIEERRADPSSNDRSFRTTASVY